MHDNQQPDWMKPMVNDWGVQWVREKFADWRKPKPGLPRRIFISREGTRFRRCINEPEIYAIAQKYGFTTLKNEKMSFAEQMSLYSGVEMVMGAHGAGFGNMLFASEKALAIEMFPKHRAPPFYRELCGQLGQKYLKLDGPITNLRPGLMVDFGDFRIDPQEVENLLSAL
jgi:capsular polysaccharide biosynthesis protein